MKVFFSLFICILSILFQTTSLKALCSPRRQCKIRWDPVCGSNGRTYPNACIFDAFQLCRLGVTIAHSGVCKPKATLPRIPCPAKSCSRVFNPVCGSDGITYSNLCTLEAYQPCKPQLREMFRGPC